MLDDLERGLWATLGRKLTEAIWAGAAAKWARKRGSQHPPHDEERGAAAVRIRRAPQWSNAMSEDRPRVRKPAAPSKSKPVKASLSVDVELHTRWSAAASMRRMTNNAFAVEALREALKGIVVIDRRKNAGHVDPNSQEGSAA